MDRYLTTKEVADRFRVQQRTVQKWVRDGKLSAVRFPEQKKLLIPESAVAEMKQR